MGMPKLRYTPDNILILVTITGGLLFVCIVIQKEKIEEIFLKAFVVVTLLRLLIDHVKKLVDEIRL